MYEGSFLTFLKANTESNYQWFLTTEPQYSLIMHVLIKISKSYFSCKLNMKISICIIWVLHYCRVQNKAARGHIDQCFQSVVSLPGASASPGNSLEMHTLGLHLRSATSETLGVSPAVCVFTSSPYNFNAPSSLRTWVPDDYVGAHPTSQMSKLRLKIKRLNCWFCNVFFTILS